MSPEPLRLLLIDDDRELCALLADFFAADPVVLKAAHDGRAGLQLALETAVDVVILLDVILRKRSRVPVIMLTARMVSAPEPFHPEELTARCELLARRAADLTKEHAGIIEIGAVRLDSAQRRAHAAGEMLPLVGLGLSIAQRAVHLHHGVITAENAEPELRVAIRLPLVIQSS